MKSTGLAGVIRFKDHKTYLNAHKTAIRQICISKEIKNRFSLIIHENMSVLCIHP